MVAGPCKVAQASQDCQEKKIAVVRPIVCIYNLLRNSILLLPCLIVYYIVTVLFLLAFWCPCMAINVSIHYNGGLLPDIILLTQCYLHRGTRLNAMKKFCIGSL